MKYTFTATAEFILKTFHRCLPSDYKQRLRTAGVNICRLTIQSVYEITLY